MSSVESVRPRARWAVIIAMLIATVGLFGCGATDPDSSGSSGSGGATRTIGTGDNISPSTPAGLTGSAVSPSQIDLSWQASRDDVAVAGYLVFRNGVFLIALGNVTTYQDTGLAVSTTYSYTVQATDTSGNLSAQTPAVILTTPAILDTTAPLPPTTLTANAVSPSQINLSWSGATDNLAVTGYRVFRNGVLVITLGNVTTYQDTVFPATTFIYTVRALDAAGNVSGLSPAASATTPPTPVDTTAPLTPSGVSANAVSDSQINLVWNSTTDNVAVAGYRVYRNGVLLTTLGNVTTYQDTTGLTPSTMYSYNVDAYDAANNISGLSGPANATTLATPDTTAPLTPTGLNANAVSPSQINLSWSATTDNVAVTGYGILGNGVLLINLGNVTTYQDIGLAAVTTYTYRVRAFDAAGNVSGQSTAASATTPAVPDTIAPSTPTNLIANTVSASRIDLNWSASTDNVAVTGYRVYRNGVFLIALGNVTTYQNTGLSASTTYSYHVDAVDAVGNASGLSTVAAATTLAPDTATLAWDAVTGASGYRVYYGTFPGTYLQSIGGGLDAGNFTTYTVPGLVSGTTYYFAATAYDSSNNESVYSNLVSKTIP